MQQRHITFLTILFQFATTSIILFIIYIIFALLDNEQEADMVNEAAFMIFQPVFGIIITLATIAACFVVGIPIRFIPKLKAWWISKPHFTIIGMGVGIILLMLSLVPSLMHPVKTMIDGQGEVKRMPNTEIAITGWISTGFFLLHFYPFSLIAWIRKKISIKKKEEIQAH